ncbi:DUF4153 domain-containing protein [Litchfieldia salsa]|uniref:Uncharacterized protein n=1 Tax=Litchfieldia salsa TaxID=930152 RepID=A0A1H0VT04_9BACI|nr:DUF4173 domain-containing protein [Litchfieldia salsa]SDP81371.1 protein of unknown function [Litchfieldia salsa]
MEMKIEKRDMKFLLVCLIVGIVAEEAFYRDLIGISYFVFISAFYAVFYLRFRSFSFSHQRLGYLVLISIWLLASSYYLYDITVFYALNILVIPALVIFHLVLITSPKKMEWNKLNFLSYVLLRLGNGILYNFRFIAHLTGSLKQNSNPKKYDVWKKIMIGIAISIPILFVILNLLASADVQFERLLSNIPTLLSFNPETFFRIVVILIYTFGFFGFLQVLSQKKIQAIQKESHFNPMVLDGIITLTVLLLLNLVYVLFVAVQFKYFFSGTLEDGYTYAQYARRGFFELLFVTLINLTVITVVIQFTKTSIEGLRKTIQLALTVLVLTSGVLLVSAFMRMALYEDAYGATFTRILVTSFMIFLMVIFAYTLVKIWLKRLSLFHFYFISSIVFYTGINLVNFDQIVVDRNIARYESTGKIDIDYLNRLSSTGVLGLIELYEKNPEIPGLEELLKQRKAEREYIKSDTWQSHNLTRDKAYEKLGLLDL